jgi:hypothetical protein
MTSSPDTPSASAREDFDLVATIRRAQAQGIDPRRVLLALGLPPDAADSPSDAAPPPA